MSTPPHAANRAAQVEQARAHHQRGEFAAAAPLYLAAIEQNPRECEAFRLLGVLLAQVGRGGEALALLKVAREIAPENPEILDNFGAVLLEAGGVDEALAALTEAVALAPRSFSPRNNLGVALRRAQKYPDALIAFRAALALCPDHIGARNDYALTLLDLGRPEEAATGFDAALALAPHNAALWRNRGVALKRLGRLDEALASYDRALALAPAEADVWHNRGNLFLALAQAEAALENFAKARAQNPQNAEYAYSEAIALLQTGDFLRGFAAYESRRARPAFRQNIFARDSGKPEWRGEAISGRTLFVYAEQGLGDTLQFCRFAKILAARRVRVFLAAPARLRALVQTLDSDILVLTEQDAPPPFDLHAPLMSLPWLLGWTLADAPGATQYLVAERARKSRWRRRLSTRGFRIGVNWRGDPTNLLALERSFPLAALAPVAKIPGVRLISLQKNADQTEIAQATENFHLEILGEDFDSGPDAFLDAAAVMASLDLVISCDTAIVHLAGALGAKCWAALPFASEWRWLQNREDSPWYPSLTLFRQPTPGDWAAVFAEMAQRLDAGGL